MSTASASVLSHLPAAWPVNQHYKGRLSFPHESFPSAYFDFFACASTLGHRQEFCDFSLSAIQLGHLTYLRADAIL